MIADTDLEVINAFGVWGEKKFMGRVYDGIHRITYVIDEEGCTGCTLCAKRCPEEAITGEKKQPHHLDLEKCIKCGICYDACKFDAVRIQ